MEKKEFIVFVDLYLNKYWSSSVLGKTFNFNIDDISMKCHFPGLPSEWKDPSKIEHLNYLLSSPTISSKYKYGNDEIFYGKPCVYPDGVSYVEKVVFSFELDDYDDNKLNSIYLSIDNVMNKFYKLCYIVNESTNFSGKVNQRARGISIYDHSLGKRIPFVQEIEIFGITEGYSDSITKKEVETIFDIISNNKEIPSEYDYLISGIKACEKEDNRKCVLELSTACEIAITSKINEIQNRLSIGDFLNDYKMLAQKYKLLGLLGEDTSFADINVITKARNDAIHKGVEVTSKQAYDAIKVCRRILERLSKFY